MSDLSPLSDDFVVPAGVIYLDGNSLGLASRKSLASLETASRAWTDLAIQGWTDGPAPWFTMGRRLSGLLAPLLGADAGEVHIGDSTTVRLHQILQTFFRPDGERNRILIDSLAFPSDRYAVESTMKLRNLDPAKNLSVVESSDGYLLDENAISERIVSDRSLAIAVLPSVLYRSGQRLDMARIESAARRADVTVVWDCAHSAGAIDHDFHADGVRIAFGCTYKWLNGGPGAPAWSFVDKALLSAYPGMTGWFGCDPAVQFEMRSEFAPAPDANRFAIGTPHILSAAPLAGSLELIRSIGIEKIRQRSLELTALLRSEIAQHIGTVRVEIVTPKEDYRRGGHLAIRTKNARELSFALRRLGVVPDFRPPDLIRLAPSPLFNSGDDCIAAVRILAQLLRNPVEMQPANDSPVT